MELSGFGHNLCDMLGRGELFLFENSAFFSIDRFWGK